MIEPPLPRPADALAHLTALYARALAEGGRDTQTSREVESMHSPIELLGEAATRIPDLAICGAALDHPDRLLDTDYAYALLGERAAGALRLTHRALERDTQALGYDIDRWLDQAYHHADLLLWDRLEPLALAHEVRGLARALSAAATATAIDRVTVPTMISTALGSLLALYAVATSAQ